jgi:hypothetical protein
MKIQRMRKSALWGETRRSIKQRSRLIESTGTDRLTLESLVKIPAPIQRPLSNDSRIKPIRKSAAIVYSSAMMESINQEKSIAGSELRIDKSVKIRSEALTDPWNKDALQSAAVKKLLKNIGESDSIYLQKEDPVVSSNVLKNLGEKGFMTRQWSNDSIFNKNMERLAKRNGSKKVKIFDYAPKSEQALHEMGMTSSSLKQWKDASRKIEKSSEVGQLKKNESVDKFFQSIRDAGDGAVFVLFGHSDGKTFWFDMGKERIQISKKDIESELSGLDNLPVFVFLNCETTNKLAPAFLEAGSPLVFTSPVPLPVDGAGRFMKKVLNKINKQEIDVVDAIYDTLKEVPLPQFGPISSRDITWLVNNMA